MGEKGLPAVVIAAAGRARRFGGEQKVLAPVAGVPAVCRVAAACEKGIGPHRQLVVIGHEGDEVRNALGPAGHREFVRQHALLGTGNVLAVALEHLGPQFDGEIYFFCGDKPLLTAESVRRLRDRFRASGGAMAFLVGEIDGDPAESRQGRVLQAHEGTPRAEVLAIIERSEIEALGDGERLAFESLMGWKYDFARDHLLNVREVNVSAYVWHAGALRPHIGELPLHEDKQEYFVTDLVDIIRRHRLLVRAFPVVNGHEGLGIDTRDLLKEANGAWSRLQREQHLQVLAEPVAVAGETAGIGCATLLRRLERNTREVRASLVRAYGGRDAGLLDERRLACWQAARRFMECWGDRRVQVLRAPGRIALNPHCEHQGAWVPYGAHRRELVAVVSARDDDVFTLANVDRSHQERLSFRLSEEPHIAPLKWESGWLDYIEDREVARQREALADPRERLQSRTGSINFVKAAALRLARAAQWPLRGADIVVNGNIPVGVGQSSSSALVVATALALNDQWDLGLSARELVSACGEAEWYVGTRGGAGDHAAMLLGSGEELVAMCFEPPVTLRDTRPMPLPPDYRIIIANSCQQAIKNKEERRQFNAGIFAYRFALAYLQDALARHGADLGLNAPAPEVRFLADVNTGSFPLHAIYRLLLAIPETATPEQIRQAYPQRYQGAALGCFGTADPGQLPRHIPVRGAALYGLGRVDRGLAMHDLCARGDREAMREFGRLMYVTHDGDRVTRYHPAQGESSPYLDNLASVSDERIVKLMQAAAQPQGAHRLSAQLRSQSGFYGAGIPELDRIVDLASSLDGVLGAGLMGAGGGGCVLILARAGDEMLARLRALLDEGYYRPLGKPVEVEPWQPTACAGRLEFAPAVASYL